MRFVTIVRLVLFALLGSLAEKNHDTLKTTLESLNIFVATDSY